ncbi:hypothetical protein, partial [Thermosporothrix hazakensis]|uniref:hypothetical protein n=1 Tax=Thermosporothrix hazakensis TaxID=644383 RepID=UPI001B877585
MRHPLFPPNPDLLHSRTGTSSGFVPIFGIPNSPGQTNPASRFGGTCWREAVFGNPVPHHNTNALANSTTPQRRQVGDTLQ